MKAITISQPYASLIADGEKWVENRTWATKYRGPIAIHAGKGSQYLNAERLKSYPTGCVIAVARLAECVLLEQIRRYGTHPDYALDFICATSRTFKEAFEHQHTEGPWCWLLEDVQKIEPVEINGKQGIWEWNQKKD